MWIYIFYFFGASVLFAAEPPVAGEPIQILPKEEIHLALPSWEADLIGFHFKDDASYFNQKVVRSQKYYLTSTFMVVSTLAIFFRWKSLGFIRFFQIEFFALILSYLAGSDGVDLFNSYFLPNLTQKENQLAGNLVLSHADYLCFEKGMKQVTRSSAKFEEILTFIKPIYLKPSDFDRFPVYLDRELITSEKALQLFSNMNKKDPQNAFLHYQFNHLYCEP